MESRDLDAWIRPADGWPSWATSVTYHYDAHPQASAPDPLESGANCQRYAYAVLALFGRDVPPHRSSELWEDMSLSHPDAADAQDLDLVLFNGADTAWGAHVGVVFGGKVLHLCSEEGRPAIWGWEEFSRRPRYERVIGLVRVPDGSGAR